MKLGMVLYSNDPETVFNAFRFGAFALQHGDSVDAFLLGKGVECDALDEGEFEVAEQIQRFLELGGKTYGCTTCLKIRKKEGTEACPLATMADMYRLVAQSDKVLTF